MRDAASFVCWAFARAYSPAVMRPFVHVLSKAMLITSLFDREVGGTMYHIIDCTTPYIHTQLLSSISFLWITNIIMIVQINCRRAASAAYQENVGRQGNENFPLGIETISLADFYALSSRSNSYLKVAIEVAKLSEENLISISQHLRYCMFFTCFLISVNYVIANFF